VRDRAKQIQEIRRDLERVKEAGGSNKMRMWLQRGKVKVGGLKERWEKAITDWFLPLFNWNRRSLFRVIRSGDSSEPDVLCEDERTKERLWIEVTTAYYNDDHARTEWEKARGKSSKPYWLTQPDRVENQRLFDQVEERLREKLGKPTNHYRVLEPVLLVVFTRSFRLYLGNLLVRRRLEALVVPDVHPFREVYIVSEAPEVYRLFPERGMIL